MSDMNKVDFDDKTTIYEYFKEHNSFLIACISGVLAIISFYAGVLSYISLRIYLNEYNIRTDVVQINGQGSLFYKVIAYIIFYITITISIFIVKNYIHQRDINLAAKLYLSVSNENYASCNLPNERRRENYYTFMSVIPCIISISFAGLLLVLTSSYITCATPIFIILIITIVFINAYLSERRTNKRYKIKEIEKRVQRIKNEKKTEDKNDEDIKNMVKDVDYIFNSLSNRGKITNGHVFICLASIVISMLITFGYVIVTSYRDVHDQRKYPIYYEDDKQYAVIYQNEKFSILEQIEINGDDLFIYRNKQRYLSSDDLNIEYKHFKNIKKVDSSDSLKETQLVDEQLMISEESVGEDNEIGMQQNND